jgi:hypothetical protein
MTRHTVEITYCAGTVRFTPAERAALLGLLVSTLRQPDGCGVNLAPLQSAYGRILGGDYMTTAESMERLPEGWGLSPGTARPINQTAYDLATLAALRARGKAVTGKHTAP